MGTQPTKSLFWNAGILIAVLLLSVTTSQAWWWSKDLKKDTEEKITKMLERSQQQIFSSVHPVGSATGVLLNKLVLADQLGHATDSEKSVAWVYFEYTLFWKGPIIQNGRTVLGTLVNAKTGEIVNSKVIETNGITNEQAAYDVGYVLGALLKGDN